ncbi:MAG: sugar phosphate isomerase/epimerase [Clostridia bacterium]|nr:sugar phosphate isomerase/epimerase [Clostridia bacterium]
MEIGLGVFDGFEHEELARLLKDLGVSRTFLVSETPDFDNVMRIFTENGIVCETLHAPFNNINALWGDDREAAEQMLRRLKDSVDKCARYNIPVTVVHLSSGCPMPQIHDVGVKRFESLFDYANQKGVTVALENQRYLENLSYFLNRYQTLGFCWDNGHEYGFTKGIRFMDLFADRLRALHIHDNRCGVNTDDHLLPFDGKIDFEQVARDIADSSYRGTLMLEIGKAVKIDGVEVYKDLSGEQYLVKAAESAKKLARMIERCRTKGEGR